MELLEFQNNINRKWQKKIHRSCWIAFLVILTVELVIFFSYLGFGAIEPDGIWFYLLIRIVFPSGVNLVTLSITRWLMYSEKFSVEMKNYAVCINILIVCIVTAAVHNYYYIIWMAPSVALFYSTLFHNNKILTSIYIGTIFSSFISMTINIIEGEFDVMTNMIYCVLTIGMFTCGYFISRMIIKQHRIQLEYTYQELEKKQRLIERLDIEPMTRLYNRKAFDRNMQEVLAKGVKLATYKKKYVWLAIFDLDYFKTINDIYGHLEGDKVLLAVASILENTIAKEGRVYRYGGEEFAVLTHPCTEEEVYEMTEKIRKKVELLRFEFDKERQVTISAGVAPYEQKRTAENWIKLADDALYFAKNNGRNQIKIEK